MNPNKLFVAFQIAANASPQEVNDLIDSINKFFGRDDSDGIAPKVIADAQAAGATQVATNVSNFGNTTPPTTNAAPAGNVQRDKNGMPWDERIHSSSKNFNANGTWRYRKGVDEGTKTKVEAELRAAANIAPTTTAPAAPVETPAAPVQQSLPPMPGATAAAPSLPPIPGAPAVDPRYTNFVQFIAANMHSESNPTGRITPDWLKQALTHYQVPNGDMQNLAHSPDAIPGIEAGIKQALGVA